MIDDREKRLAALAWAISGAFGPVIPLVIFALNHKKSKFIAFHALQAALSFLLMLAVAIVGGVVMGGGTLWIVIADGVPEPGTPMPESLRLVTLALAGVAVAIYVGVLFVSLRFASGAARGHWVRFPFISRLAATLYDVSDIRVSRAAEGSQPDPA